MGTKGAKRNRCTRQPIHMGTDHQRLLHPMGTPRLRRKANRPTSTITTTPHKNVATTRSIHPKHPQHTINSIRPQTIRELHRRNRHQTNPPNTRTLTRIHRKGNRRHRPTTTPTTNLRIPTSLRRMNNSQRNRTHLPAHHPSTTAQRTTRTMGRRNHYGTTWNSHHNN